MQPRQGLMCSSPEIAGRRPLPLPPPLHPVDPAPLSPDSSPLYLRGCAFLSLCRKDQQEEQELFEVEEEPEEEEQEELVLGEEEEDTVRVAPVPLTSGPVPGVFASTKLKYLCLQLSICSELTYSSRQTLLPFRTVSIPVSQQSRYEKLKR